MNNSELKTRKAVKHRLNMLEPGIMMIRIICIFLGAGLFFWAFDFDTACVVSLVSAGVVFAVLMILLVIEAYQDNALDDIFTLRDDEDYEEDYVR